MSLLFTHQGLSHYNEKDQTCWSAERSGDSCLANLDDFLKRAHKRKKYICMHLLLDLGNFHYYENCYLDISFKHSYPYLFFNCIFFLLRLRKYSRFTRPLNILLPFENKLNFNGLM